MSAATWRQDGRAWVLATEAGRLAYVGPFGHGHDPERGGWDAKVFGDAREVRDYRIFSARSRDENLVDAKRFVEETLGLKPLVRPREVVAVLAVPAPRDPGGLLAEGRCGWPPAVAWTDRQPDGWHWRVGNTRNGYALPLLWDSELVPEGWDRARRVLWYGTPDPLDRRESWREFEPGINPVLSAIAPVEALVGLGFAERVVTLARIDGHLVEVECQR